MKPVWVLTVWVALGLAACTPSEASVVVEWTTANEVNTAGFNLYRSEHPDGPYSRVNPSLIPASTDPLAGSEYEFEDTSVQAGRTYYYQLEDVEYSGATNRHGPIVVTAPGLSPWMVMALGALAVVAAGLVTAARRRLGRSRSVPALPAQPGSEAPLLANERR
jgi:hypothetical protein